MSNKGFRSPFQGIILLMDQILHHLGACNFQHFKDLRWCKISSINSRGFIEASPRFIGLIRVRGGFRLFYWRNSRF